MANKLPHPVRQSEYWMRTISFAGLHRILKAVADFPNGLRASEINKLVQEKDISLTRRSSSPAPTTLYHYRNTLLHLHALERDGQMLRVNYEDPNVYKLLCQPAPAKGDQALCDAAKDLFAALVLKNEQCRSLFFDLFMPSDASFDSVSSFRQNGVPVKWSRPRSSHVKEVIFQNSTTGHTAYLTSYASVAAILYGVRYWARDELELIDEYSQRSDGSTIMFPVLHTGLSEKGIDSAVLKTIRFILSLRTPGEWTSFSVFDLIVCCCEDRRQPIRVLFRAIDWLLREWPHHTVLIPTSRALATLAATSPPREDLELKRYYKTSNGGPYISHIRIHRDITLKPTGSSQIIMSDILQKLRLDSNPFEPSAAGAPLLGELSPPKKLAEKTKELLDVHQTGQGVKAIVIVGEYGLGKTCLLQWLHSEIFPSRQIKSFYFDNPGVQFYDLANMLLRTIGRKDFAKFIWELAGSRVSGSYQGRLFEKGYEEYLSSSYRRRQDVTSSLQEAIINADVTTDEQIAYCLSRIVTEIVKQPYFEYRDFIPRQKGSMVPEGEEAPYFRAILKTISQGMTAKAVAFLIDEFEEIGLQKRLTRRAAHDYLATLKRLINLAQSEQVNFWVVLSMTPDAYEITKELEPSLIERISAQILSIELLTSSEALALMKSRITAARSEETNGSMGDLFPFPDDIVFRPNIYSNPRRLVKTCFRAIAQADSDVQLPFTEDYLHKIEEELYPSSTTSGNAQL